MQKQLDQPSCRLGLGKAGLSFQQEPLGIQSICACRLSKHSPGPGLKTPRSACLLARSPQKKVVENQKEPGENSTMYADGDVHKRSGNVAALSPLHDVLAHEPYQEVQHHLLQAGGRVRYHLLYQKIPVQERNDQNRTWICLAWGSSC